MVYYSHMGQLLQLRNRNDATVMTVSKGLCRAISTVNTESLGYNQMPDHTKVAQEKFQKENGN